MSAPTLSDLFHLSPLSDSLKQRLSGSLNLGDTQSANIKMANITAFQNQISALSPDDRITHFKRLIEEERAYVLATTTDKSLLSLWQEKARKEFNSGLSCLTHLDLLEDFSGREHAHKLIVLTAAGRYAQTSSDYFTQDLARIYNKNPQDSVKTFNRKVFTLVGQENSYEFRKHVENTRICQENALDIYGFIPIVSTFTGMGRILLAVYHIAIDTFKSLANMTLSWVTSSLETSTEKGVYARFYRILVVHDLLNVCRGLLEMTGFIGNFASWLLTKFIRAHYETEEPRRGVYDLQGNKGSYNASLYQETVEREKSFDHVSHCLEDLQSTVTDQHRSSLQKVGQLESSVNAIGHELQMLREIIGVQQKHLDQFTQQLSSKQQPNAHQSIIMDPIAPIMGVDQKTGSTGKHKEADEQQS